MALKERWCVLDSSGSVQGPVTDSYEQHNEVLSSIQSWEFLDQLSYQLLKKDTAPYSQLYVTCT
jgi:hypothetical protein